MKKHLSIILVILLLLSQTSLSYAEVFKNETVYVNLTHQGATKDISVVNHISGYSSDEYFVDYGDYDSVEVLVDDVKAIVQDGSLKWPTAFLKNKDIYYEASIKKDLPMDLSISYFLDGQEIEAMDLAGKTGDFKIEIEIKNSPDLTTQIQIPLDLNVFSDIKPNGGISSLVGKTMTVVYNHLPMGDAVYSLEAYGENIHLDPVLMASTSGAIEIPDNLTGGIDQLTDGIDELSDATSKLEDGSREISKGTQSLVSGLRSLSTGIASLYSGASDLNTNSDSIINGFKEINQGLILLKDNMATIVSSVDATNTGLSELNTSAQELNMGLQGINEGLGGVSGGIIALDSGLGQLNTSNKQLTELAQSLANSSDPSVQALAQGVIAQAGAIEALSAGASDASTGIQALAENTNALSEGFGQFSGGLNELSLGFGQLSQGLKAVPSSLEEMVEGNTQLINGIDPLFAGISSLTGGIGKLNSQTKAMPSQVEELAAGQRSLSDGLRDLNQEGFKEIKDALGEFDLNGDEEKEAYNSFVDNEKNKNSNVQFVMKTPPIQVDELELVKEDIPKEDKSIWQRFLDLFR